MSDFFLLVDPQTRSHGKAPKVYLLYVLEPAALKNPDNGIEIKGIFIFILPAA